MKQHDGGEEVKGRRSRRWSGKGREREIEREWGQEWEREIVRERSREGGRVSAGEKTSELLIQNQVTPVKPVKTSYNHWLA